MPQLTFATLPGQWSIHQASFPTAWCSHHYATWQKGCYTFYRVKHDGYQLIHKALIIWKKGKNRQESIWSNVRTHEFSPLKRSRISEMKTDKLANCIRLGPSLETLCKWSTGVISKKNDNTDGPAVHEGNIIQTVPGLNIAEEIILEK